MATRSSYRAVVRAFFLVLLSGLYGCDERPIPTPPDLNGAPAQLPPQSPSDAILAAVPAAVVAALTVYAWNELIKACVPPMIDGWVLTKRLMPAVTNTCAWNAATNVAGGFVAAKAVPSVKVVATRDRLYPYFRSI